METQKFIENAISDNNVVLFMKGTAQFPQCGFSGKIVDVIGVQKTALIGSLLVLLSCILTLFYTSIFFLGLGLFFLGLGWNFTFISISSAISFFSTKYSSDLNIRSDMYVFAGSAFTHLILGFSYFNLGYRTIASLGILITLWLVFKTQRLDHSIDSS